VRVVSADRGFVLAAVDAVQAGASALDRTDEVCTTGEGTAARASHRAAVPLTRKAREALSALGSRVVAYRSALTSLAAASRAVDGTAREALAAAVRDGRAEAGAVSRFLLQVKRVWPQYDQLDADEDTWISRAVSAWYRTPKEGGLAYALLVDSDRPALAAARGGLADAAEQVRGPSMRQSATLALADRALSVFRPKP
jgi:hypothetical protein